MEITQKYIDNLTYQIVGHAIEVHRELGPGLLEEVYEECLLYLLKENGYHVQSQQEVPIVFKGITLKTRLRYDLLVEDLIIVENKSVIAIPPIFAAQTMSYMKMLKKPKGILLNFNVVNLVNDGLKTYVNDIYADLPKC
jgi:GxxExxY protein